MMSPRDIKRGEEEQADAVVATLFVPINPETIVTASLEPCSMFPGTDTWITFDASSRASKSYQSCVKA